MKEYESNHRKNSTTEDTEITELQNYFFTFCVFSVLCGYIYHQHKFSKEGKMALKIISFIFVISLVFGFPASTQVNNVPFDVNKVINQVTERRSFDISSDPLLPESTGEFLIDTSIVYIPTSGNQEYPSIAFDGTNFLVVWSDNRNGNWDIYGVLVNQSGFIVQPNSFPISTALYAQKYPSVVFDGTNYFVVWQDERHSAFSDIYGARVSQSGVVLDTAGIAISTALYFQYSPSVTFGGANFFVAWTDLPDEPSPRYHADIYGARINQAGVVLDSAGIVISAAQGWQEYPAIAFDGTNYLVVWEDKRSGSSDVYGARVNQAGVVLDTNGITISATANLQQSPAVAFDSINYFVVWQDQRSDSSDIYGARVNQTGAVLDPNGIPISTAVNKQGNASISFDGTNYLIVWDDKRNSNLNIYGTRVNRTGTVLNPDGIALSTVADTQWHASVAFGDSNYLVVWQDRRNSNYDIYSAKVNQSGLVLDTNGIPITATPNRQESPSLAFDGTNYFVLWQDNRKGNVFCIYGARVNQVGMVLDPNGFTISDTTSLQELPSVTFGNTNYLVVWSDWRNRPSDIYGARVNQSGVVLDPNGFCVSPTTFFSSFPSVAFDGANYFVVWEDERYSSNIYGARVNQTGIVLDTNGIPISTAPDWQSLPVIAFDGTNYLVVWQDERISFLDIYGARVNQVGIVLDTNGIPILISHYAQFNPSLAFDGTNYLVVWEEPSGIYGTRLNQTGMVLDTNGIAISTTTHNAGYPSVVFNGTDYFVIWQDNRSGSDCDIYGAMVNPSGMIVDSFPVSTQAGNQTSPKLAYGTGNQVLIIYSGWAGVVNGKPYNSMRIWGKFYPFVPGIAEENSKVKMQSAKSLDVYPNPARSFLAVRLPQTGDRTELKIFDVSGKLVKVVDNVTSAQEHKQEVRILLKGINPGIYFLRLGKETKKFLVVK